MTLEGLTVRAGRQADTNKTWIIAAWVTLLFISSFRFSGFRDPALAASGVASAENAMEVLAYAAVGLLVLKHGLTTRVPLRSGGVRLLLAFGLLSVASAIWSRVPLFSLVRGLQIVVLAMLAAFTAREWGASPHSKQSQWASIWTAFLALIVVFSLAGLFWWEGFGARVAWPGLHPGITAEYLGVGAVVGISMITGKWDLSRSLRRLLPGLVAGMIVLLILTVTRSVIVAFICALPVLVLTSSGGRRSLKALASWFLVFGLLTAALLWPEQVFTFALRGGSVDQLTSLNGRLELWSFAFDTLERSPWFGFGYGSGRIVLTERIPWSGTGHNLWVESAMSLGLVGAVLVTLLLFWVFSAAIRSHRAGPSPASNVTLGLIIFVTVESIAGVTISQPGLVLTIVALLIAAASADKPAARHLGDEV